LTDPATAAAGTINKLHRCVSADGDINGYIAELRHQAQEANAGDLRRSEAMLMSQATTLNALSHSLIGWALNHVKEGGNPAYFETNMRLAFKAQSQSRATVETLAEIKNPRQLAFIKQANLAGAINRSTTAPWSRTPATNARSSTPDRWATSASGMADHRRYKLCRLGVSFSGCLQRSFLTFH
jgi:hypothetical protein